VKLMMEPLVTILTFYQQIKTLKLENAMPIVIRLDGDSVKFASFEWTADGFKISMRWSVVNHENPPPEVDLLAEKFISQEPPPMCRMNFIDHAPANFMAFVQSMSVNPLAGTAGFGFVGSGAITSE